MTKADRKPVDSKGSIVADATIVQDIAPGITGGDMAHDLNWELRLGFLLHDVSRLRRNAADRAFRPLGITRSQWWVLAFLSREDGVSQMTLANSLELGKVALGGLIDRLEAAGFVERQPDKIDRRVKRLFLTKTGNKLIEAMNDQVRDVEHNILAGINERDLKATVRALRGMKANLMVTLDGETDKSSEGD